jgi:hypothetical protein
VGEGRATAAVARSERARDSLARMLTITTADDLLNYYKETNQKIIKQRM